MLVKNISHADDSRSMYYDDSCTRWRHHAFFLKNTSFCIYQKRHFWPGFWKPHLYRAFLNLVRVDFRALKHFFDYGEFEIFAKNFRKWSFSKTIFENLIFNKNGHAQSSHADWFFGQIFGFF